MVKYIFGITGASGGILAKRALEFMSRMECEINVIATENGAAVFHYETSFSIDGFIEGISRNAAKLILHNDGDLFSPVASGSYGIDCMMILPCSMSAAGRIANGTGGGLLVRAADVCIKERARLVIAPRETPLSTIHIKNLLSLSENGVAIVPPMPMFYSKDTSLSDVYDGITGRILKAAGIENELYKKWRS